MVVITNLPPPSHGIRHRQPSTAAVINSRALGKGTLYIAESHLSWVNDCSGDVFSLEYRSISIHAICRDLSAYPEDCLYLLLDANIDLPGPGQQNGDSESNDEDECDPGVTEVRFIPEDKSSLQTMFSAMSDCQVLHPESDDSLSEDEYHEADDDDEEEEYEDGRGRNHANGDTEMDVDEGQFDDADKPED